MGLSKYSWKEWRDIFRSKKTDEMKKPFKILCIDGGGIKGIFSAQVLAEFEKAFGSLTSEHFDLVCGTSTGGIIALGVAAGIPMKDVVGFTLKTALRYLPIEKNYGDIWSGRWY